MVGFGKIGPFTKLRILEVTGIVGVLGRGNGQPWFTWTEVRRLLISGKDATGPGKSWLPVHPELYPLGLASLFTHLVVAKISSEQRQAPCSLYK